MLGMRVGAITADSVIRKIAEGAEASINFGASFIGHPACSRYGMGLVANGVLFDAFDDSVFIGRMLAATAHIELHRNDASGVATQFLRWLAVHPAFWFPVVKWAGKKVWKMRSSLIGARGKVSTLSFIVHNFMDSGSLDRERITACAFKVMTADGPMSMCLHNAKRDSFILLPIKIRASGRDQYWQPLASDTTPVREAAGFQAAPQEQKWLKGRNRQRDSAKRRAALL